MLRSRALGALFLAASIAAPGGASGAAGRERPAQAATFPVDAHVALSCFITIGEGHLKKMADSLQVLALSDQARSADWKRIEEPLRELGTLNATALNWFALPDGSYWSAQNGREEGNLSTRAYFPKVLAGNTVLGDLVVSTATNKSVAIVAVPVRGAGGAVVGVLGASIYLDLLSERIREQMQLEENLITYAFDAVPILALDWDPKLIFTTPKELGPEIDRAFAEMLSKTEGTVRYSFRGRQRTVVFRKSELLNWWFAVGRVNGPR